MSGEKYVSTPPVSSTKSSPDFAIAAAAGKLIVGAVAVTAVAGGLAVYGVCKGASALTKYGVKKYREHIASQAMAEKVMRQNLREILNKNDQQTQQRKKLTGSVKNQLGSYSIPMRSSKGMTELGKYVGTFSDNTKRSLKSLEEGSLSKLSGIERLIPSQKECDIGWIAKECDRITRNWDTQRERIVEDELHNVIQKIDSSATAIKNAYEDMQKRIGSVSDISAQIELKKLSETAFSDAVKLIDLLASTPGTTAFEAKNLCDLTQQVNKANHLYEKGDYRGSFTMCTDIIMQGKEVLKDVLIKHQRSEIKREKLTCEIAEVIESIKSLDKIKLTHKGNEYLESLIYYCPKGFEDLQKDATELMCSMHDDMTDFELHEAELKLANLKTNFKSIYRYSWEKAIGSYKTFDCSQRIAREFYKQGYEPEDYKYECDIEGEKLHINFINRKAGNDRVTLVLNIGSTSAQAHLHQYGSASRKLPDPAIQKLLGEITKKEIETEMGVRATIQSKHEGGYSTTVEAADLNKQQAKTQVYPYRKP